MPDHAAFWRARPIDSAQRCRAHSRGLSRGPLPSLCSRPCLLQRRSTAELRCPGQRPAPPRVRTRSWHRIWASGAPPMASATVAALMVNTGTPEAARSGAVRHFLRRFLSDPRVIELPRILWLPLLYGLILPLRAPRSARKYREIWREEGSPLLLNTSRLREALARELGNARAGVRVEQAFLYSPPFVAQALDAVRTAGIRRLIVLPLYPQSSGSTTGAV